MDEFKADVNKTTIETEHTIELEECVSDGIYIHIAGTQIDKINNIEIYFKE